MPHRCASLFHSCIVFVVLDQSQMTELETISTLEPSEKSTETCTRQVQCAHAPEGGVAGVEAPASGLNDRQLHHCCPGTGEVSMKLPSEAEHLLFTDNCFSLFCDCTVHVLCLFSY